VEGGDGRRKRGGWGRERVDRRRWDDRAGGMRGRRWVGLRGEGVEEEDEEGNKGRVSREGTGEEQEGGMKGKYRGGEGEGEWESFDYLPSQSVVFREWLKRHPARWVGEGVEKGRGWLKGKQGEGWWNERGGGKWKRGSRRGRKGGERKRRVRQGEWRKEDEEGMRRRGVARGNEFD
jgi:hypothetical protein